MTATTGPGLDTLRARYGEAFGTRLPDHIRRLPWDAGRLAAHPETGKARRFIPL